jgi:hypothetical protein
MSFYRLALGILGVWRLTHLFQAEDGPCDLMARLRLAAGTGFFGALLDCFGCTSLWVAVPFALCLGDGVAHRLLLWPALSAGAFLLERATDRKPGPASALFLEHEE